jgi:alpha-tubulin suppressor-like RCC1 family protein
MVPADLPAGQAFRALLHQIRRAENKRSRLERDRLELALRLTEISDHIVHHDAELTQSVEQLIALTARLKWCPLLPRDIQLKIMGQLGPIARVKAAVACKEFRDSIKLAYAFKIYPMPKCAAVCGDEDNSHGHTLVCTPSGVFSFGSSEKGRLGHGPDRNSHAYFPEPIRALEGKMVLAVCAGKNHTVMCTTGGQLYTFGAYPAVHGNVLDECAPRLVEYPINVTGVAVGDVHTAVCTGDGKLYTIGVGSNGQLGHGDFEDGTIFRQVESLVGTNVVAVACGARHTLVRTDAGQLYTFGSNWCGQLGLGNAQDEYVPRLVELNKKIVGVAAGRFHTVACTETGELYTFGNGSSGQLGHGDNDDCHLARLVELHKKVVGVSCGGAHTLVYTVEGALYTFGSGGHGQLGHGNYDDHSVPRLVERMRGRKIAGLATGSTGIHSLVWTNDGQVFTFGAGRDGRLGVCGPINHVCRPRAMRFFNQ